MTIIEKTLRERRERIERQYDRDEKFRTDFHLGIIAGLSQAIALLEMEREE